MDWIFNHIAWWWWVGLIACTFVLREMGLCFAAFTYCIMSLMFVLVYFMWCMTFGIFFDSIWDMPWWCWLLIGGMALPGVAQASTVIYHRSDERVSNITITRK